MNRQALINGKMIQEVQSRIKLELDAISEAQGDLGRLHAAFRKANDLSAAEDSSSRLQCYIYLMSGLVVEERLNVSTMAQVNKAAELAGHMLALLKVRPIKSKLAYLHTDLHSVLSQIYRRKGMHWYSAWEQQLSRQMGNDQGNRQKGHFFLSYGNRILRLGNSRQAIELYSRALEHGLTPKQAEIAYFGEIKALRLSGELAPASIKIANCLKIATGQLAADLQWEQTIINCLIGKDLSQLFKVTRRGQSHYHPSYILESFFWAWADRRIAWQQGLPQLASIQRRKGIDLRKQMEWFEAAKLLEQCHDTDFPLSVRLGRIRSKLGLFERLITVDKELLVWLSLARWLNNNKSTELAALCLGEYRRLSLNLTNCRSVDALTLGQDLYQKEWAKMAFGTSQTAFHQGDITGAA